MKLVLEFNNKIFRKLIKPLLIIIGVLLIIGLSFATVKANDYWQVKKLVKSSDELVKQEKYQDAIDKLNLTQYRWTFKKTRQEISDKIEFNEKLLNDQNNFNLGSTLLEESNWSEAKEAYSKVSSAFPHYLDAQDKITECQNKIDEAGYKTNHQPTDVSKTFPVNNDNSSDSNQDVSESIETTSQTAIFDFTVGESSAYCYYYVIPSYVGGPLTDKCYLQIKYNTSFFDIKIPSSRGVGEGWGIIHFPSKDVQIFGQSTGLNGPDYKNLIDKKMLETGRPISGDFYLFYSGQTVHKKANITPKIIPMPQGD